MNSKSLALLLMSLVSCFSHEDEQEPELQTEDMYPISDFSEQAYETACTLTMIPNFEVNGDTYTCDQFRVTDTDHDGSIDEVILVEDNNRMTRYIAESRYSANDMAIFSQFADNLYNFAGITSGRRQAASTQLEQFDSFSEILHNYATSDSEDRQSAIVLQRVFSQAWASWQENMLYDTFFQTLGHHILENEDERNNVYNHLLRGMYADALEVTEVPNRMVALMSIYVGTLMVDYSIQNDIIPQAQQLPRCWDQGEHGIRVVPRGQRNLVSLQTYIGQADASNNSMTSTYGIIFNSMRDILSSIPHFCQCSNYSDYPFPDIEGMNYLHCLVESALAYVESGSGYHLEGENVSNCPQITRRAPIVHSNSRDGGSIVPSLP